jgi:GT2 family glycosyltransferase
MKIYIIIVTYNGEQWIRKCLENLSKSTLKCETIIVDNYSNDNTVSIVNEYSNIILLKQSKNLGFGVANNIGLRYAMHENADYCLLINQDVYIDSTVIENLIKIHKSNNDYGVISPMHLDGTGTNLDKNFKDYISQSNSLMSDLILNKKLKKIYEVPFVNAAFWLLTSQVLNNIGGFDPIFYHYAEDNNYCQRLKYHNYKVGIVPLEYIKHDRENRVVEIIPIFSDKYYYNYTKDLKALYADINLKTVNYFFKLEKIKYLRKVLFSLLNFDFKSFKGYNKQFKLIGKTQKEIMKSRAINIFKSSHYL